jgi:hypothetical protein
LDRLDRKAGVAAGLLTASLALAVAPPTAAANPPTSVTLMLHNVGSGPVPVPRMAGDTVIRVPVYPGASPSARPFGRQDEVELPGSPYLRAAGRAFSVHASLDAVLTWYTHVLTHRGLVVNGRGTGGGPHGLTFAMIGFAPHGWLHQAHPVELDVIVEPASHGTRLALWATQIMTPPRPSKSVIPPDIRVITGTVTPGGRVRITNPTAIARLLQALNSLSVVMAGTYSCPAIRETAHLTLWPRRGPSIPVSIAVGCTVSIDRIPLQDNGRVGPALTWAFRHPTR